MNDKNEDNYMSYREYLFLWLMTMLPIYTNGYNKIADSFSEAASSLRSLGDALSKLDARITEDPDADQ